MRYFDANICRFLILLRIFFLRHPVSFCNSEQSGIVKKYFPRETYKFARSNFELTMAIMAAISKKKWTFAMRTGKRLIKNRFYAAFYYNRLFRRNVESNDPYDARLNAIVIAAEQKKKKKKVQHVSSLDYFARKLLYKERDRVSRFFKLIRDNISP